MRLKHLISVLLLLTASATRVCAAEQGARKPFSFVVLGHVRGNDNGTMNPWIDEVLAEVRNLEPDMIFLTGDMIWGDVWNVVPDADVITQDWDRLDAALEQLGIPVYRVPGNHDVHDLVTRDVYFARYGTLPQAFTYRGSRFVLLNSSYAPEETDPPGRRRSYLDRIHPYLRGKQLDAKQIAFVRRELSEGHPYDHVFLFMHHLLWWHKEEAAWWRDVHPLLVGRNVRVVFGGDPGPMKFSHMRRDGIDYVQSSVQGDVSIKVLRDYESRRLRSQQFDNYLYVSVNGPEVTIETKVVGEISSGKFTPQRWRAVHKYERPEA